MDRVHWTLTAKPQLGSQLQKVIIHPKVMIVQEACKRRGNLNTVYFTLEVLCDSMLTLYNLGHRPSLRFPARSQITLANEGNKRIDLPDGAATFLADYQQRQNVEATN